MSFRSMDEILNKAKAATKSKKPMAKPKKGGKPKKITTKEPKRPRADGTTR
jgi:hypothetical protein